MKAPYSRILVYLDGSEGSMSAAMYAVLLARASGAALHAVYVVNTKAISDLVNARVFISSEKQEYLTDLRKDASRHLRHMEKLAASKDVDVTLESREGVPSAEVSSYIKDHGIDLLVLGSINVVRSRREELTSENDRMMRTAPCPVLVARDDDDLWEMFEEN